VLVSLSTNGNPGGVSLRTETYTPTLYDENENPISCPPVTVACGDSTLGTTASNFGINQAVINSRGGPSLCLGSDPRGHVILTDSGSGNWRGIFVGLNNGDSTGSMDMAVEIEN